MRLLLLSITLFLVGCGPNIAFEQTYDLGEDWSYDEIMKFDIVVEDTTQLYDLQFLLDHTADFTYQNLYVNIVTSYPSGSKIKDELSLQLANKMGEFLGNCSGDNCTLTVVLQEGFRFQELGNHSITIAQHSRKKSLDGIYAGTLRLVEYETAE